VCACAGLLAGSFITSSSRFKYFDINIYVYVYVCTYISILIWIYVVYMYACTHVCVYVYMYICIYVYMYICMYVCISIYVHMYGMIYVYMHICIYSYVRIHTYMYVCTCAAHLLWAQYSRYMIKYEVQSRIHRIQPKYLFLYACVSISPYMYSDLRCSRLRFQILSRARPR